MILFSINNNNVTYTSLTYIIVTHIGVIAGHVPLKILTDGKLMLSSTNNWKLTSEKLLKKKKKKSIHPYFNTVRNILLNYI